MLARNESKILGEIRDLRKEVVKLQAERDALRDTSKLERDYTSAKKELTDVRIEYDREREKWDREKRDVEHMVGLEKKRQEFEIDSTKRDTRLTVREENLKADRERFEEEMKFTRDRFEQEVKYLKDLIVEALSRLPVVEVEKHISIGANGKGDDD